MNSSNATILNKSYDLLKVLSELVKNFPRDQKFVLGDRIYNLSADILELYIEAFYTTTSSNKKALLKKLNIQLEKLRFFLRLAYEKDLFSSGLYRKLSEQIDELGRMTGGWYKSL
jgi:four helix bundle protein